MNIDRYRSAALAAAVVLLGGAGAVAVSQAASAATCGRLFDDFSYASSSDAALTRNGWVPRSYAGGPGVPGATWSAQNLSFPTSDGQKVLQLTSSTDGTGTGTNHAELYTSQKRYLEGTYASRVKFSDTPASGADGDHINQTFFTISPLAYDLDPTYSELDISEYLPNGGWGETGPIN
ncbi:glycoside hydrolase family 16 protein, partial [Actinoplanes sp. NPDC051633]|uniref:glycoside hydrolase family 16 protein n=1 Tax=Actinoplanes sp. NPDC051633 TaxID=3155670 RepID=UPI003427D542